MVPTSIQELTQLFDHTILKPEAKPADISRICQEAREFSFRTVCVNSAFIPQVVQELEGCAVLPISVVGFPLGAMAIPAKEYETQRAIDDGAKEIDTVIAIGRYLAGDHDYVRQDIAAVVQAANRVPVKVILETAFLQPEQIAELTRWCADAGAKFVKTSTGFASRGASVEDITRMHQTLQSMNLEDQVGIKASGGIRDLGFLKQLTAAGATRIGASASVSIVKEFERGD